MRRLIPAMLLIVMCQRLSAAADSQPAGPAASQPKITIKASVEEGKKMLVATVTANGKPLEGARVAFFAQRTFGELALGEEVTLDDGTAAVPFPEGLPGGATGELQIIARLKAPAQYASAAATASVSGGNLIPPETDPFPRAIWAPRPPIPLILVFVVLLGGVWSTYAYVLIQLRKIHKGARS